MIDLNIAKDLMVDFSNEVYETFEGSHPKFLVSEWEDKIKLCRLKSKSATIQAEDEIIQLWAAIESSSVEDFVTMTIAQDLKYIKMRQGLSKLFKSSLLAASTAEPENLPLVFQSILQNAAEMLKVFANGDEVMLERLMSILNTMASALQEATENGV